MCCCSSCRRWARSRKRRSSWIRREVSSRRSNPARARSKTRSAGDKTPIVAVLRFDNETGDPNMTRFSDAVTDMLVVELTARSDGHYRVIGNARVLRVARDQRDLNAVASSLGASYAVLGQVQRSGDETRILAHLIHVPDQTHVWVTRIDRVRDDELTLESQVAQTSPTSFPQRYAPPSFHSPHVRAQVSETERFLSSHFSGALSWGNRLQFALVRAKSAEVISGGAHV